MAVPRRLALVVCTLGLACSVDKSLNDVPDYCSKIPEAEEFNAITATACETSDPKKRDLVNRVAGYAHTCKRITAKPRHADEPIAVEWHTPHAHSITEHAVHLHFTLHASEQETCRSLLVITSLDGAERAQHVQLEASSVEIERDLVGLTYGRHSFVVKVFHDCLDSSTSALYREPTEFSTSWFTDKRNIKISMGSPVAHEHYDEEAPIPIHFGLQRILVVDTLSLAIDGQPPFFFENFNSKVKSATDSLPTSIVYDHVPPPIFGGQHWLNISVLDIQHRVQLEHIVPFVIVKQTEPRRPPRIGEFSTNEIIVGLKHRSFVYKHVCLTPNDEMLYWPDVHEYDFPLLPPAEDLARNAACNRPLDGWGATIVPLRGPNARDVSKTMWHEAVGDSAARTMVWSRPADSEASHVLLDDLFAIFTVMSELQDSSSDFGVLVFDRHTSDASSSLSLNVRQLYSGVSSNVWFMSDLVNADTKPTWNQQSLHATKPDDVLCFSSMVTGFVGLGAHCTTNEYSPPMIPRHYDDSTSSWPHFRRSFLSTIASDLAIPTFSTERVPQVLVLVEGGRSYFTNAAEITPIIDNHFGDSVKISTYDVAHANLPDLAAAIADSAVLVAAGCMTCSALGLFIGEGSVIIDMLRYIGKNASAPVGASFMWRSLPHVQVLYYPVLDSDVAEPSAAEYVHFSRHMTARVDPVRLQGTVADALKLSQRFVTEDRVQPASAKWPPGNKQCKELIWHFPQLHKLLLESRELPRNSWCPYLLHEVSSRRILWHGPPFNE